MAIEYQCCVTNFYWQIHNLVDVELLCKGLLLTLLISMRGLVCTCQNSNTAAIGLNYVSRHQIWYNYGTTATRGGKQTWWGEFP